MSFFNALLDVYFKTNNHGEIIFYPWGRLTYGFLIESKEIQEEVRKSLKRLYIIFFTICMVTCLWLTFQGILNDNMIWTMAFLVLASLTLQYFYINKIT